MNKTLKRAGMLAVAAVGAVSTGWALYGVKIWLTFGRPEHSNGARDELLDRFMPTYEVAERHQVTVAAPAAITFAAARDMDLHQSRIVRAIFRGRELLMLEPHRARLPRSLLDETLSIGWGILAEVPDREVVVGAVCQPWNADPQFRALPPDEFAAFHKPGYAKIVWTLRAEPVHSSTSVFRTETRVVTTDPESRARFRRYWAALSPGILLIRRLSLPLVKNDAERRTRTGVR